MSNILSELNAGVLVLKLNRAPLNAFDDALFSELKDRVESASRDPGVRCIVLTSNFEKAFTAGLDLKAAAIGGSHEREYGRRVLLIKHHIDHLQAAVSSLEKSRVPTIVALHGLVIGAGVDIATACDIRLASQQCVFTVKEVDIGIAADIGTLQRLPKVCGNSSKVRELVYTGRNFNSQEANEIGLLSQIVPGGLKEVQAEAIKLAKIIASKSPLAVAASKQVLNHSRDHTVAEGLEYVGILNAGLLQGEELEKAKQAFTSRSQIEWRPLAKL